MTLKYKFIRFIGVGIINTLFGVGMYCGLLFVGMNYYWAVALSTILGVIFNFQTIGHFVFANKDSSRICKFVLVYIVSYLINVLLIKILVDLVGINTYLAGLISAPIIALLSFALHNTYVFKENINEKN